MPMPFFSSFDKKIGLDLGSDRVRIWSDSQGLVVDEPTSIAVDQLTNRVLAVGQDAVEMTGRVRDSIKVYFPVVAGELVDPKLVSALLRVLLQRVFRAGYLLKPTLMVALPAHISQIDRDAVVELLYQLGAQEVLVIAQPLAAAIGAGIPIAQTSGSCVLYLGGGVIEAAVISLSSIVRSRHSKYAGHYCDQMIISTIRNQLALKIGAEQAREIKKVLGTLKPEEQESMISGQNLTDGAPGEMIISSAVIYPVINAMAERYLRLLKTLLEDVPAELVTDIIDRGILMTGGLAQLQGLSEYLVGELGVAVSVVDQPDQAVIKGVATVLQHLELFKESIGYQA